jgi:transposase-like protein DUF772
MIRMLVDVFAIRSKRLICRKVQVNLAYRWFCKLGIEDAIPDHSAFSRARNERFRQGDIFRRVFERVAEACIAAGLVGGEGFAVDASLVAADGNKQRSIAGQDWHKDRDPRRSSRAVKKYLAALDDTAWGAASEVVPKFVSPSDPAAQWTGAHKGPAFFAYANNYLIDLKFGVIVDVEASRAIRQVEVGAAKTMIERTEQRFAIKPERLARYGLRFGCQPRLAGQPGQDNAAHSGQRQVEARGWDLQPRRLPLRQRAQRLYLPGRQGFDDDRQAGQRWGDPLLPTQGARLPRLSP